MTSPAPSRIVAVEPVLPPHRYRQSEISEALAPLLTSDRAHADLLRRLHANCGVEHRHLALPLEAYAGLDGFGAANAVFVDVALDLAERALKGALDGAGLVPEDVDYLLFTSVTGISAPSVDALLVQRAGLRPDVKRLPSFGLGCVAGAAGLARVDDYLAGHPGEVGVLLSVELCSLTLQRDDPGTANLVASGLFGDGASAVVLVGADRAADSGRPGWEVRATASRTHPDTTDVLGWDVGGSGFRIVLSADLPTVLARTLGPEVEGFLRDRVAGGVGGVDRWVVHPGGPKVLDTVADVLGLEPSALAASRRSLAEVGNLSSSSVLHVLAQTPATAGESVVVLGIGPGVSTELLLLERVA